MVNIGLIGSVSVGKTTILRLFVKYLNTKKIDTIEGGKACSVEKTDFSGEAVLDPETGVKETKTIHPNRVLFKTGEKINHTLFAPGGDRGRAVVKMGVITISRIAKQIIAVFACDQPLDEQFLFFNDVRFFPRSIYVCLNKYDKIQDSVKDKDKFLNEMKSNITEFFAKRKMTIKEWFLTCAEPVEGMLEYNDRIAQMILHICTEGQKEEAKKSGPPSTPSP